MKRPDWDEFGFTLALMYSTRGTCDRLRTAIVLVDKNNRFISAGYNGSPSKMPHCDDVGHRIVDNHCIRASHCEDNAIDNAVDLRRLKGASAYMLDSPCRRCAQRLIVNGVKRILYLREFTNMHDVEKAHIEEMVRAYKVKFQQVNLDPRKLIVNALAVLESHGGILWTPPS